MANRARDFIARFFTDTARFDTSKVTGELDDVGDASKQAARTTESSFDRIRHKVEATGHDVAHAGKETFGEAGKEVGAEFAQNIGSGLAAGDISTIAQDSAGGLVAAFTAVGGPIGLALAGVATVATGVFASVTANAARMAADVDAIFQAMLAGADKQQALQDAAVRAFGGTVPEALKEAKKQADLAGVSVNDLLNALLNPGEADKLAAALDQVNAKAAGYVAGGRAGGAVIAANVQAAKDLADKLREAATNTRAAKDAQVILNGALQSGVDIAKQLGQTTADAANSLSTTRSQLGAAYNQLVPSSSAPGGARQ